MLSWIAKIYHYIVGAIDDVKKWILSIIQAVYSFIDKQINSLGGELLGVWNELYGFYQAVKRFAESVWLTLNVLIKSTFQEVTSWVSKIFNDIRSALDATIRTLNTWIDKVSKDIQKLWNDITSWVLKNVWDPLYKVLLGAVRWIGSTGAFMYDLLTHPDKLVTLLGHYLWLSYLGLIKTHAKPIGRWFLHTMVGMASEVGDVLEAIISALL